MEFTVCTDNPIENFKSYGLNKYLISLKWLTQKHCPMSSNWESRFKFEFGKETYSWMQ